MRGMSQVGILPDQEILREVVETLAPIDRTPCSVGEAEAARWLEQMFGKLGCEVKVEQETGWGPFPPTSVALSILGALAAWLSLRGRRAIAVLLAGVAAAGIADEAGNGPRIVRKLMRRPKVTANVVAEAGDRASGRTLVVLAHHDAPQTGIVFDQSGPKALYRRFPRVGRSLNRGGRQWLLILAGPVLALLAAITGRRATARAALVLSSGSAGFLADIWRSPTVAGANDNLSGVAVLVGLADMLERSPVPGLRVQLVSCGSEETLQDGIRAFMARHRGELDRRRTWFLSFDTVGSSELVLVEGECALVKETYTDRSFANLVAQAAEEEGFLSERGFYTRASTDAIIPSRAGYPTASLLSIEPWGMPANYHLRTDTPDRLNYDTLVAATRLAYEVARAIPDQA